MSFDTRVEDQNGWFTFWSGAHDPARVRDFDCYLFWRDGEGHAPPLASFVNLESLRVPIQATASRCRPASSISPASRSSRSTAISTRGS